MSNLTMVLLLGVAAYKSSPHMELLVNWIASTMARAVFGLPPFYVTTLAAGSMKIGFGQFLQAAVIGRLLHFGVIAVAPSVIRGLWR